MKRIIYVALLLLLSKNAFCQSKEQLRDSLTAITTQLKAHPTSIDLLLKKAGYSMQLESSLICKEIRTTCNSNAFGI